MPSLVLIANPAAGRGRGSRELPRARAAFQAVGVDDARLTSGPGDEARLVREALGAGARTIAVLGGDGTWSKAAAAVVEAKSDCRLAFLSAGSGNDFVKSLAAPAGDFERMARLCVDGPDRLIDVGRVDSAIFLNVAGFGFDAAVTARIAATPMLTGQTVYYYSALRELFGYRGIQVREADDRATGGNYQHVLTIAFANGRSFGSDFLIAPDARVDDGLLDVVTIGSAGPLRRLALFAAATRGKHLDAPEVRHRRTAIMRITFHGPADYQADGELRRTASGQVEIAIVPKALRVVGG